MPRWVGEKNWKKIAASAKKDWKESYWELGMKRNFNGAEQPWSFLLPHDLAVKQSLKLKIFSKGDKNTRLPIKNHQLQLQRYEI